MTNESDDSNPNKQNKKVKFDYYSILRRHRFQSVYSQAVSEMNMSLHRESLAQIRYSSKAAPTTNFNDSFNLKTRLRLNVAGKRFEVCFFLLFFLKIHENS